VSNSVNEIKLLPYDTIEKAVKGESEALQTVVCHYSHYIAALSLRRSYDQYGNPSYHINEDLRCRLETKLIIAVLDFDLS